VYHRHADSVLRTPTSTAALLLELR
jgi:hypothetical protein